MGSFNHLSMGWLLANRIDYYYLLTCLWYWSLGTVSNDQHENSGLNDPIMTCDIISVRIWPLSAVHRH